MSGHLDRIKRIDIKLCGLKNHNNRQLKFKKAAIVSFSVS